MKKPKMSKKKPIVNKPKEANKVLTSARGPLLMGKKK
jgi:hypothetical protein